MSKIYDVREIEMPAEEFYTLQNDDNYEQLQAKYMDYVHYTEMRREETANVLRRFIRIEPRVHAPKTIKRILDRQTNGDPFHFDEIRDVPKSGMQYSWQVLPPIFADKITIAGTFLVEPVNQHRCRRTIHGELTVRVLGVGGILGKFAVAELVKGYGKVPTVASAWLNGERV